MSASESSDDEENCSFEYWNDWQPPPVGEATSIPNRKGTRVIFGNKDKIKSVSSMDDNEKFGNWIPPLHFDSEEKKMSLKKKMLTSSQQKREEMSNCTSEISEKNTNDFIDNFTQMSESIPLNENFKWERILNCDWGERVELHDVTSFSDGDIMWGVVKLGVFASIKLWVNEYGNVCGSAEGKISKEGSGETTLISISNTQHLRKMLNITNAQWCSLSEIIQQNKITLKFEALSSSNVLKMTSLEKLWFFMCKRRHFLPDQCMLVKFCGAIKSLKEFKIIPKLIVQEIRDINGLPIP